MKKVVCLIVIAAAVLLAYPAHAAEVQEVSITPSADSTIISESDEKLGASSALVSEKGEQYSRFLIKFDLGVIPTNASIQSATLTLYQTDASGSSVSINAYKITSSWSEGSVSGTNAPTADKGVLYGSLMVDGGVESKIFSQDFSELVQSWIATPSNNFGLLFEGPQTMENETETYLHQFGSKESGNKPTLKVSFELVDDEKPIITGVNVSNINTSSVTISWKTDEAATSFVEYGKTVEHGKIAGSGEFVTDHQVEMDGLASNTTYHFVVVSKDSSDNESKSTDQTFTTAEKTELEEEEQLVEMTQENVSDDILPPLNLAANFSREEGVVKLSWDESETEGVEKYNIYRSNEDDVSYELIGSQVGDSFTDESVEEGVTYFYKVRAFKEGLESADSNEQIVVVEKQNIVQEVTGGSFWKGFALFNAVLLPVFAVAYFVYKKKTSKESKGEKKKRKKKSK